MDKHGILLRSAGLGLVAALATSSASAQTTTLDLSRPSHENLAALDLFDGTLVDMVLPERAGAPLDAPIFIEGGWHTLVLEPYSLRTDDYRLLVQVEDGSLVEHDSAGPATYRGFVTGFEDSGVAVSLIDGQLSGIISLRRGEPDWGIQPLTDVEPTASRRAHVVYDMRDTVERNTTCATDTLTGFVQEPAPAAAPGGGGGTNFKICQLAFDADIEFYQWNGSSVPATEADIEAVVNGVALKYLTSTEIYYEITTIIVRTSEPDPYSTSSPGGLLNQFDNHWSFNQGGVPRDLAHLFTGRNLDGTTIGIASLNVICSFSSGYGLSESNFTNQIGSRIGLTSHEIGHNWSAQHCDGISDCQIMCSGLGGCGGINAFGQNAINSIVNKKNSSGCLSNPPAPTLTTINPGAGVQPLSGQEVTVIGTSFFSTQSVDIGGVPVNDFTIVSNTKVRFDAPLPAALGNVNVTVTNQTGTTNAGTLTYVATEPPLMIVPAGLPQGQALTWTYAAGASEIGIVWVSGSNVTFPFEGNTILLNGILLFSQFLDPAGFGSVSFPLNLGVGTILFSQLLTFDGIELGSSGIKPTVISF